MTYLIPKHPVLRAGFAFAVLGLLVGRELGHVPLRACSIRWDLTQAGHGVWHFDPKSFFDPGIERVAVTLLRPGEGAPSWRVDDEGVAQLTVVLDEFELGAKSWMPLRKDVRWNARAVVGRSDGLGWWGGGVFDAGDGCPLSLSMEFDTCSSAVGACPRSFLRDQILERIHKRLEDQLNWRLSRERP